MEADTKTDIDTNNVDDFTQETDAFEQIPKLEEESQQEQQEEEQPVVKNHPSKKLDLSNPIELTSETIVMVAGRKCALRVDPVTNQLVAFPIRPPNSTGEYWFECMKFYNINTVTQILWQNMVII